MWQKANISRRSETAHRCASHQALTRPSQGFIGSNRIEKMKNDVGLVEPGSGAARAITR